MGCLSFLSVSISVPKRSRKSFLVGQVRIEELDGGGVVRLEIDGLVHSPHAAAADFFDDLVGTELFELHGRAKPA